MTTADPPLLLPAPTEPLRLAAPEPTPPPESAGRRHAKAITAVSLAAFLGIAFAVGWFFHHRRADAAEDANQRQREEMPMASVIAAHRSPALSEVLLPGSLSPMTEASLYARAAGYVRRRYVDIGDTVKKGQVLAVIESPELDQQVVQGLATIAQARQQLNQVRASIGDARAKLDLARVGWQRWDVLQQANAVAKQDADQKRQEYESAQSTLAQVEANVGSAQANVRAAEANQRRLVALQDFERLRAPFDGVVTARSFDEGALVGSNGASLAGGTSSSTSSSSTGSTSSSGSGDSSGGGSSPSAGPPLFRIAQVDRLRVYVTVPQGNATAIQVGSDATVLIQEFQTPVAGRVSRTARALDPDSRTLLTEVQVDNRDHRLLPGMYAQVRFASARSNPPLLVPGEALIVRGSSMQVATLGPLDADERSRLPPASPDSNCARQVHLQTVAVGRDYGTEVEVTQGLRDGEFIVADPGDSVHDKAVLLPHLQADDKGGKDDDKKGGGQKGGDAKGGDAKGGDAKGGDQKGGDQKGGGGKEGATAQGGGKKPGGGAGQGAPDEEQQQRREAQQTCVEEAARQQSARRRQQAAQVPETEPGQPVASGLAPGGESDKTPAGIQSPSMAAPTQGRKK